MGFGGIGIIIIGPGIMTILEIIGMELGTAFFDRTEMIPGGVET